MSSFTQQDPYQELEDILARFIRDMETQQEAPPLLSSLMRENPQVRVWLEVIKYTNEKPMQTLSRIFQGIFLFGLYTASDGKSYPDYIREWGDGVTAGPSTIPCRFGPKCKKGEACAFAHRNTKAPKDAFLVSRKFTSPEFTGQELARVEGAVKYILVSRNRSGTPLQVEFKTLVEDKAFEQALNLGRELTESTLVSLVMALGLEFSPSTGMISLPPSV
jgi:hypothetical protein